MISRQLYKVSVTKPGCRISLYFYLTVMISLEIYNNI